MTKTFGLLTLVSALFLTSCTSNESAVKKLALADAETQFTETLKKESDDLITQSEWLRNSYVEFMKKHAEFDVESVKIEGNLGVASATVIAYPPGQRKILAKIAGTVDSSKARQFNFANALQLISQQTGAPAAVEKQSAGVFKYQKISTGDWKLLN